MQILNKTLLPLVLVSAVLSACGGGGGSTSSTQQPVLAAQITASNYAAVAAQGFTSGDNFSGSSTGGGANVVNVATQMDGVFNLFNSTVSRLPVLAQDFSEACENGGRLSGRFELVQAGSLAAGSKLNINATNCNAGGVNLNGGLALEVAAGSGRNLNVKYTDLTFTNGNSKVVINGDNRLSWEGNKVTSSGSSLYLLAVENGVQIAERTLINYSISNGNAFSDNLALNCDLTVKSATLGSMNLNVKTTDSFVRNASGVPQSGSMLISSGGRTVKLTALGGNSVRVDYSEKGDGSVTATQTLSWEQLRALR